jgi:hypothetical protein
MLTVRDLIREIERLEALLEIRNEEAIKKDLESLYEALMAEKEVRP